ncbi:outer membrane protein transport protein [Aeromonas diversa]|uniref:Long-chain fatty acid transport protein n=1 Tax=Aeromonas diversa CDC 2478-85 TaxID=1268237 RepID=N9VAI3_9GAMM|nr:outer membrane protein transport protein [Aeromonas diversa]ENY72232.1 long-chain fatty acid transport protein [Aeromonas diversa CDC 2478-85]
MTNASFKKSLLAAAVALASTQAHSAAFQLNEHSASGLGRAYAGEAAVADNASVLSRNPAAMTMFDKMAVSVSGTYIHPDVDVEGKINGVIPASEKGIAPDAFVPAAYFIQPLKEDLAWGIAMFSNYGLSTEYPEAYHAGSAAGNTELLTFNINPNLAYRVAPGFSLGAGINLVYAKAELNRFAGVLAPVLSQKTGMPISADTNISHMKGDDWGHGWNVGALYEFNQDNRLALTYRSQVNIKFKGDYKGLSTIAAGKPGKTVDGELNMELPAQAEFAGYHRLNPQFAVHYSVNWTDWNAFQELKATSDSCVSSDGVGVCLNKPEKFKDSMRYAIGGTWYLNPSWEARVGFAYDNSPIEPEYRSLSIPDSDRLWYSAGATYHIDQDMSVDFGMAYLDGKEVDVNEGLVSHEDQSLRWKGTSHGNAFIASAQFNMKF